MKKASIILSSIKTLFWLILLVMMTASIGLKPFLMYYISPLLIVFVLNALSTYLLIKDKMLFLIGVLPSVYMLFMTFFQGPEDYLAKGIYLATPLVIIDILVVLLYFLHSRNKKKNKIS